MQGLWRAIEGSDSQPSRSITLGLETTSALRGFEDVVNQRMIQCSTVVDFLTEVREILRQICTAPEYSSVRRSLTDE
jgi:hypothetical protein